MIAIKVLKIEKDTWKDWIMRIRLGKERNGDG